MTSQDAVSLTKSLLRFDTVNPPGRERDCAKYAGAMLQDWGYSVEFFDMTGNTVDVATLPATALRMPNTCRSPG